MSSQDALFYDDFRGAMRHLIGALGGPKVVGGFLRSTWPVEKAAGWINDCLNPNRDSKFSFEDLAALFKLARERHIHCAMWQLCDEAGYAHPEIATPLTETQKLAARRLKWAEEGKQIADDEAALERADALRDVRNVKAINR